MVCYNFFEYWILWFKLPFLSMSLRKRWDGCFSFVKIINRKLYRYIPIILDIHIDISYILNKLLEASTYQCSYYIHSTQTYHTHIWLNSEPRTVIECQYWSVLQPSAFHQCIESSTYFNQNVGRSWTIFPPSNASSFSI